MSTNPNDVGGEWDAGNFQIVPPGYYKAVIKTADAKTSQNGNKMVQLVLSIEHDEYDGVTIYNHLVFRPEPDNFNNTKRKWFQESAGLQYSLTDSNDVIAKQIVNRKVVIKVKTKTDGDGKERNEICGVHPYSYLSSQPDEKLDLGDDLDDNYL